MKKLISLSRDDIESLTKLIEYNYDDEKKDFLEQHENFEDDDFKDEQIIRTLYHQKDVKNHIFVHILHLFNELNEAGAWE